MDKTLDYKGRWRNKTVAFRVSEEEAKLINDCVALSGLTKQDYIVRRLQCRDVVVQGNQRYLATDVTVEGDYSNAAFFAALDLFDNDVTVTGLSEQSHQGDRAYIKFFEMLAKGTPTVHIGDCPDLGPILMAVAAAKNGAVFTGTKRLRIKESDRGAAMAAELSKCGVSVKVHEDSIVVYPISFHAPDEPLFGYNDHRIVMALSTLLCMTGGEIEGAEAVRKSFPEYFELMKSLGADFTVSD